MTTSEWIDKLTTLLTVVFSSTVVVTVLQKLFNRKADREKATFDAQKDRDDKAKRERDSDELLAQSRAIAQKTALDSSAAAYKQVADRCDACLDELHGLRDVTGRLVDAVEALMEADNADSRAQARAAIRLARRAM